MVNKQTLEEYLKQQENFYNEHLKFHPSNAFCGTAGAEETKHVEELLKNLSNDEVVHLVTSAGFPDIVGESDKPENARDICLNVIDELDREDFYREYNMIIAARTS